MSYWLPGAVLIKVWGLVRLEASVQIGETYKAEDYKHQTVLNSFKTTK